MYSIRYVFEQQPYHFSYHHGIEWWTFVKEAYLKNGDIPWLAHSPHLFPCDYFPWESLKAKVFKHKLQTINKLKDSSLFIHHLTAAIVKVMTKYLKWAWWLEFKSWIRLLAFHITLIPLDKVCIQLFSLQLWENSSANWAF